ncbi:cytochrome c family protein [Rhodobacteraceae bacterium NNCM2]|nr:cytochrome c family protein [Coraliihabitans acroporae]
MNADKFNMIAGSAIGALLVFLLLGFFSSQIFGTFAVGHHEPASHAFAVKLENPTVEDTGGIDYAALVANADLAKGEKLFSKCKACHKTEEGAHGVGPSLYGVVGRDVGALGDYGYSPAMSGHGGTWDLETLSAFLENPKGEVPGTKMGFAGLKKPQDRVDLIAWLNEDDGSPIELAAAPAETATDAGDASHGEAASEAEAAPAATDDAEAAPAATDDSSEAPAEGADNTQVAAAPAGGQYSDLIAAIDVKAGEKAFRKCKACHKLDEGKNGVGPSLYDIVGHPVGAVEGYNYSSAMADKGGDWTVDELMSFLESPKSYVPGTKMSFAGVKKPQDRMNIIGYLNEVGGSPVPLQ